MSKSTATPKLLTFSLVLLLLLPAIYIAHAINNTGNYTSLPGNVTDGLNQAFNSSPDSNHTPFVVQPANQTPAGAPTTITPYIPSKMHELVLSAYSIVSGQMLDIKALLTYENLTPIPSQELMFYGNETQIGSNQTSETGWAQINWIPNISGNYIINATYSGNHALNIFPAFNYTQFVVLPTNQTPTTRVATNITTPLAQEITPVLTAAQNHFSLNENPEFELSYITEEEFTESDKKSAVSAHSKPEKASKTLITEKETINTFVYYNGKLTGIKPEIEKLREGKFSIKLPKKRSLQAGIYRLKVNLTKDNKTYTQEQEFPWGLVSLNTKKSIYKPGETAGFIIVVLDKEGHPVCSADISLTVTNPENEKTIYSTTDRTIIAGSECGLYNANYPTAIEGNHGIDIIAVIDGVNVDFNTNFLVRWDYEFDIIRTADSKIDPTMQDLFHVSIDIISFTDTDFIMTKESVPAEFTVVTDANIRENGDTKILTWNRTLIENRTSVNYTYSVPSIWPYLYALGPAEIDYDSKTFTEPRPWYLAVDPNEEWIPAQATGSDSTDVTGKINESDDVNVQQIKTNVMTYINNTPWNGSLPSTAINIDIVYYYEIDAVSNAPDLHINVQNASEFVSDACIDSPPTIGTHSCNLTDKAGIDTVSEVNELLVQIKVTNPGAAPDSIDLDYNYLSVNYDIPPKTNETSVNVTAVEVNSTICVNHTVTKGTYNIDSTWIEITYPGGTATNITTTNSTGICGAGGNVYGVNISVGSATGTLTVNTSWVNDTQGNEVCEDPYPNTDVTVVTPAPTSVIVKTYRNSGYSETDKFFTRNDIIHIEADVTNPAGNITDANVTADILNSTNAVVDTVNLTHIGGGSSLYHGNWTSDSSDNPGVYTMNVTATNPYGSKTDNNTFHLYSGANVSAYHMDYNEDGVNESIMENKHLITVFNEIDNTDNLILCLEQKNTNVSYTFGTISDGNATNNGGITTDNVTNRKYYSFSFATGESLDSVDIDMKTNITTGSLTTNESVESAWADSTDYTSEANVSDDSYAESGTADCTIGMVGSCDAYTDWIYVNYTDIVDITRVEAHLNWTSCTAGTCNSHFYGKNNQTGQELCDSSIEQTDTVITLEFDEKSKKYGFRGRCEAIGTEGQEVIGCKLWLDYTNATSLSCTVITTSINSTIQMRSPGADYLVYKLHNFDSNIQNISDIWSDIAGTLGSSASDDRYHLENGTDSLITDLTPDTWNNYAQANSNYSLIYDNSSSGDSVNDNIIAWVRFNESENITFQDAGLWNDSTDNTEGLRIRYNTTNATATDEVNYILAFTKGSWSTIHKWMPTIEGGNFPTVNFMTSPTLAPSTVTVKTYRNSPYSDTDKFFDRQQTIYVEANVTDSYGDPLTNATVIANFTINGAVENSTTLTHYSGASYRGNWTTNSTQTVGVYNVTVRANNSAGSKTGSNSLHLYSGENVSAYRIDYNDDGVNESIMENKHLIVVFNETDNTDKLILYLEQKDTNISYPFGTTSDGNATNNGGITTEDVINKKYYSFSFTSEGENIVSVDYRFRANLTNDEGNTITKNVSYQNNPDIVMKSMSTPAIIVDQANTISVTINVTNGNGTAGLGTWGVNVSLWNITINKLNITNWTNTSGADPSRHTFSVVINDIDNDGDNDIVTGSADSGLLTGYVYIWENPGNGSGIDAWSKTSVSAGDSARTVAIGDIDRDGDKDIVSGHDDDKMYVWENPGNSANITTWSNTCVSSTGASSHKIYSVTIGDIDNDGDVDIITGEGYNNDRISLFENPGNESSIDITTWSKTNITSTTDVWSVAVGDIDNDGDLDIIAGSWDGGLALFENPGNESSTNISTWLKTNTTLSNYIRSVAIGDVDSDGYLDIVSGWSAANTGAIHLWKNPGNESSTNISTWSNTSISNSIEVMSVNINDIDSDGDNDIISAADDGIITVFINPTWEERTIDFTTSIMRSVSVGDIDNDGDNDIVAGRSTGEVIVLNNSDVISTFITSDVKSFTNATGEEQTYSLSWTPTAIGFYNLTAIADNNGNYSEVLENNNRVILEVECLSLSITSFNTTISLRDGDVDYLLYRLNDFDSNIQNISDIWSDIAGTMGSSVSDDRYHLENGTDGLVTSLTNDTWNNYMPANSNYSLIYDNSSSGDSVNDNVIAWIRLNETENITFQDSGLWNDSSGMGGLRIRYNTTNTNSTDEVNYILAFTKGDWGTIDKWMPTIKAGNFPTVNFMTAPLGGDQADPTVLLNSPSNNTNQSTLSITFNCTACDNINLTNVTLYNDLDGSWGPNGTNASGINNTAYIFDRTAPGDGTYKWNCRACDNSSNCAFNATNWTLTIDTTPPAIALPIYQNATRKRSSDSLTLNISVDDGSGVGVDACIVNITTSGTGNQTIPYSTGWCNGTYALTGASEGNQTIHIYANDTLGNTDLNNSFAVDIDNTAPIYSNVNPANGSTFSEPATISFNITTGEPANMTLYYWNSSGTWTLTNTTFTTLPSNTSQSLAADTYNWNFTVCDQVGNCNESGNYKFTVQTSGDSDPPVIYLESPKNQSCPTTSIWFNVTLDEPGDWCGYSLDGAQNITMTNSSGNWNNLTTVSEGTHNVTFSCNDTTGNMNSSAITEYFTVDLTYPKYSLNQTNSTEAGASTLFSLYWTDNIQLAGYIFSFDNGTGTFNNDSYIEMTGATNWSNATKTINSTAGTTIQWIIYANDTADNTNTSGTYTFQTTDETPPVISDINNNPDAQGFGENVTINATVTDAGDVDTVLVEITDPDTQKTNYTMTNITATYFEYNYTSYINGTYAYTIYANDTLGNQENSSASTFQMYVNMTIQVRTLNDSYTDNEIVNLTDPPGGEAFSLDLSKLPVKDKKQEHNICGKTENQINPSLTNNSFVFNTSTLFCFFSNLSSDQIRQLCINASAKYSTSPMSGQNCLASEILSKYLSNETIFILCLNSEKAGYISSSSNPDLSQIWLQYLPISNSKKSGQIVSILLENNKSYFEPVHDINIDIATLESRTTNIQINPIDLSCLNLSFFIFLPSSTANLSASSSDNLLFDANAFSNNKLNLSDVLSLTSNNLASIALLSTSDQSTSGCDFICISSSEGTLTANSPISITSSNNARQNYLNKLGENTPHEYKEVTNHAPVSHNPICLAISPASKTAIASNLLSRFSLDQRTQLNLSANATYSVSLVCSLNNSFALGRQSSNSHAGTTLIFLLNKASNSEKSSLDNLDFLSSSSLCLSSSINSNSGAIASILSQNNISAVLPFASIQEQSTLASITTSIYTNPEYFFLYLSCNDSDISLPISSASFSDNLLLETMDLNKANSETLSLIASLATADQFIILNSSISFFKSSDTDNVIVGIFKTSEIFNLFNNVYPAQLYKSFGMAPIITFATVHSTKVVPGNTRTITAQIKDSAGTETVTAGMGGIETIDMVLKQGNIYEGIWQNTWLVHGTEIKDYSTTITAANIPRKITPALTAAKSHFSLNENPEFELLYITEEEFTESGKKSAISTHSKPQKASKTLITEKETINTFVYHNGKLTVIKPEIEKQREGKFSIKLPKKRSLQAGIYKLKVMLTKDSKTYTQEQEFAWGVLAINTHKSIYLENETAFIGIAVLDDNGRMVCDAPVTLEITDPLNNREILSTENSKIKISPECPVYGVTNLPDYYANYTVNSVGTYVMNLTAVTSNGIRTIQDNFTVQRSVDFDVARDGPTRIYPPVPYTLNFTIKANKDYNGLIKEYVPASFEITPQDGLTVETSGDTKVLTWDRKLNKGETHSIYYEFDAPDISPYLFVLGGFGIGSFREGRTWKIASDAEEEKWFENCADLGDWALEPPAGWSAGTECDSSGTEDNMTRGPTDLSDAYSANLSFWWKATKIDADEYFRVWVSDDNSNWVKMFEWVGNTSDIQGDLIDEYALEDNISLTSTVYIIFECKSGGGEHCYVDNINLSYIPDNPLNWSDPHENATTVYRNDKVKFNTTWEDDHGLSGYIFSISQDGSWVNSSFTGFGGTWNVSENITEITAAGGTAVYWRFYANDSGGNWNQTDVQSFTVANSVVVENLTVAPQKVLNNTNVSISVDTASIKGSVDTVTAIICYPNGTWKENVTLAGSGTYTGNTSKINFYPHGNYSVTIQANDSTGDVNDSVESWFTPYLVLSDSQNITINGSFGDWASVKNVTDVVGDAGSWETNTSYNYSIVSEEGDGGTDGDIRLFGDDPTDRYHEHVSFSLKPKYKIYDIDRFYIDIGFVANNPTTLNIIANISYCEISSYDAGSACSGAETKIKTDYNISNAWGTIAGWKEIVLDNNMTFLDNAKYYKIFFDNDGDSDNDGTTDGYYIREDYSPSEGQTYYKRDGSGFDYDGYGDLNFSGIASIGVGGDDFDLKAISLANNNTHLFAMIQVNGTLDFSNSTEYYRLFISRNDSTGNETTPETGINLPVKYDYRVQVNGSICCVYNSTDISNNISGCSFSSNSDTIELSVLLTDLNITPGDNINVTFETGSSTQSYDFAPDYRSFLSYGVVLSAAGETPPIITIDSPKNQSYPTTTIWFNATLNEPGDWCGYSLDGAPNVTMTNTSGNWNNQTTVDEGSHNVTFSCNDTSGNMNSSAITEYFKVDITYPKYTTYNPQEGSIFSKNAEVNFNISTDENTNMTVYYWKSSTIYTLTNTSYTLLPQNTSSPLSVGAYNWNFTVCDQAGLCNQSDTHTFSVHGSLKYNEFKGTGSTTNLDFISADANITNLMLETAHGLINWTQNITLNDTYDLDTAVDITYNKIFVNTTMYPNLNTSAHLTMQNLNFGGVKILKDGADCPSAICQNITWDTQTGLLEFDVTEFSEYKAAEANQSKIDNNKTGSLSARIYVLMKVQFYQAGAWIDENTVVDDEVSRNISAGEILKLDSLFNGKWNTTQNATHGSGTYRVYAAVTDENNNVLKNIDGTWLNATYNFTVTLSEENPPIITIVSPLNKTYNTSSVWFNATLNEPGDWCGYSLDGAPNITMDGSATTWYKQNTTMTLGSHYVTFSCNDTGGLMNTTDPLYFTVHNTTSINPVLTDSATPNPGDIVNLSARLLNSTSNGIPDQNISFYYNDTYIDYNITNSTGWAVYTWDTTGVTPPGTYFINATFNGNDTLYAYRSHNDTTQIIISYKSISIHETDNATDKLWKLQNIPVDFNYYCYAGLDSCNDNYANNSDGDGTPTNFTIENIGDTVDVVAYVTADYDNSHYYICSSNDTGDDNDHDSCKTAPATGENGADNLQIYIPAISQWRSIPNTNRDGTASALAIACDIPASENISNIDFQVRAPYGTLGSYTATITFVAYADLCTNGQEGNYFQP